MHNFSTPDTSSISYACLYIYIREREVQHTHIYIYICVCVDRRVYLYLTEFFLLNHGDDVSTDNLLIPKKFLSVSSLSFFFKYTVTVPPVNTPLVCRVHLL